MSIMKHLTINDLELQYDISYNEFGYETHFYFGTRTITYRKYLLFGSKITKKYPREIFTLDYNIMDNRISKEKLRRDLEYGISCIKRQKEIDNGELI